MPINHLREDEIIQPKLNLAIIGRLVSYLRPYRIQVG